MKKLAIVLMMMSIKYTVIFVISFVSKGLKNILNHKVILIIFIKNNNANNFVLINLSYYCSVCDKTIELKSETKHFKSPTHKEYEKFIQINNTFQNPNFFDVDKFFNNYFTNHNKKFELYLIGADFKVDLDNILNAHIKTE